MYFTRSSLMANSLIFSREGFLETHYEEILNSMFGLDPLFKGLGQRKTSGEIKELSSKTTQAVFRSYFYFY